MSKSESLLQRRLQHYRGNVPNHITCRTTGKLIRMVGLTLEAVGLHVSIGARCFAHTEYDEAIECEVVGFSGEKTYLMPIGDTFGLAPGAKMTATSGATTVAVGNTLLGRVIDGNGLPLDDLGPIHCNAQLPLYGVVLNPLTRPPIDAVIDVGVRAINSLLTVGLGQRIGLFAGSGVGKSVLLSMMARYTSADVIVVGLIGERGREVQEFIQHNLSDSIRSKSCVVVAPANTPPLVRVHAALRATSIAEYFRDQGLNVLLLMDSVSRFAQAQRQIGLAIGEPPATKGYPPSVFSAIPQLIERAGRGGQQGGSITAFYTVFVEGDDLQDPIADAARGILDGHIVLSRRLADVGHFPAIDIQASISRVMNQIIDSQHQQKARQLRQLYTLYQENQDLIQVGAYTPGANPELDAAVKMYPQIVNFLRQPADSPAQVAESIQQLVELLQGNTALQTGYST